MTDSSANSFFAFEADFTESLRCIPMIVRYKLDTCGVKLKLSHWNQLSQIERQQLVAAPCITATESADYRAQLHAWVQHHSGDLPSDLPLEAQPAWMDVTQIPASVVAAATAVSHELTLAQWGELSPLQRFALIKLSRSQHENANFLPALREFHLASAPL
jgi:hypothetical protein